MTVLSSAARYYLWLEPVDMRKSFNGLQGIVYTPDQPHLAS